MMTKSLHMRSSTAKTISTWTRALAGGLVILAATHASAADCDAKLETTLSSGIGAKPTEAELKAVLSPMMAKPRYFEAKCDRPRLDHPLYPGVPVKSCNYEHLGLKGWVMLANPSADLATKWIISACADQKDAKTCVVRLTSHAWCSSQLTFPVAGNIIQPAPASGGKAERGVNTAFLHGIAITRPDWLAEQSAIDLETQKARFTELAARHGAFKGKASQEARPAGVRREVFTQYAMGSANLQVGDLGRSCPTSAQRGAWLEVSQALYNRGWRTGKNPMFEAAAKALMAGENPGKIACP